MSESCRVEKAYRDDGSKTLQIVCKRRELPQFCLLDEFTSRGIKYCVFCGSELNDETE